MDVPESTGRLGDPPRRGRRRAEDVEPTGRHGHSGPDGSGWRIERPSLSRLEPVKLGPPPLNRREPVRDNRSLSRREPAQGPSVPPPLSGRLHPADPIVRVRREDLDATGQLPPLDFGGHVDVPSARPGPADSYGQLAPVRRAGGSNGRRY